LDLADTLLFLSRIHYTIQNGLKFRRIGGGNIDKPEG
jgi:hypothetical protein